MKPSTVLYTQRPDLATLEEFDLEMDRRGFIGMRVAPIAEVGAQTGNVGRIPIEQLLQRRETKRDSRGGYNRGSFTFTAETYQTAENGFEMKKDDRDSAIYASYLDYEASLTQICFDTVLRNQEGRISDMIFNGTTWTGATLKTTVGTTWTRANAATAFPISDVEAAVQKVWANSGMWPNTLILNELVARDLRFNDEVIERLHSYGAGVSTMPADISDELLARCFNIKRLVVSKAANNTANEGQTMAIAPLWPSSMAMVCRVAETNDPREPCIARTFHWGEDGSLPGGLVETYIDPTVRAEIIRVRHETVEKVRYVEMGHLLAGIN